MEVLDTSIANVSLPHIAGGLAASVDESTWILTSYLVSNAIVLPMSGWFSSLIGRKRFYMTCVALFTISSFLCGLAPNLGMLIFFRVLQGVGGGGLQPSEQSILADTFPPAKRGMAFAMYGMAVVVAPGDRTDAGRLHHRQLQLALDFLHQRSHRHHLAAADVAADHRPAASERRTKKQRDSRSITSAWACWRWASARCKWCSTRASATIGSNRTSFSSLTVISVVALVAVVFWEWRHAHPIIDLKLFRDRSFAIGNTMMFMLGFVLAGHHAAAPAVLQTLLGYPARAGGTGADARRLADSAVHAAGGISAVANSIRGG